MRPIIVLLSTLVMFGCTSPSATTIDGELCYDNVIYIYHSRLGGAIRGLTVKFNTSGEIQTCSL